MSAVQYILGLGPSVMLPLVLLVVGLIFGLSFGKAFRGGLYVGVAFVGINLAIGLLMQNLGPATQAMVKHTGVSLSIVDVGWPAGASLTWASGLAALLIPVGVLVNMALLLFNLTKTLDVDIWNYWVFGFSGAIIMSMTGSLVWGLVAFVVTEIIILKIADLTAPRVHEYFDMPGVSIPHGNAAPFALLAMGFEKIYNRIPGLRDWKLDAETIRKRLGIVGEPIVIGLVLGLVVSALAGYDLKGILTASVALAAAMVILPRMVAFLMEGLIPISEAAGEWMKKRAPGREVNIGLDAAVLAGDPAVLATGLLLIPITIGLAIILPGNRVLPFADVVGLPFVISLVVPVHRGNVLRSLITGVFVAAMALWIGTDMAPAFTTAAQAAGVQLPQGATSVVSLLGGTSPVTWLMTLVARFF